jgi:cytochrome P450
MPVHDAPVSGCPVHVGDTDLVDPHLYSDGDAHEVWRELRAEEGLSWHQVDEQRGFWSVVHFKETDHVLRNTALFTSERGTMLELLGMDDPAGGKQLAVTDPPRHTIMQARLKKALAVKAVDRQRETIRELITDLLAPIGDGGVFDWGQAMLAMPMSVTGTMMGLPPEDCFFVSGIT